MKRDLCGLMQRVPGDHAIPEKGMPRRQIANTRRYLPQVCDAMGEISLAEQHRQRIRERQGMVKD
jgi:hypothetical protein